MTLIEWLITAIVVWGAAVITLAFFVGKDCGPDSSEQRRDIQRKKREDWR